MGYSCRPSGSLELGSLEHLRIEIQSLRKSVASFFRINVIECNNYKVTIGQYKHLYGE
jgi:hypothetical protein